MKEKVKLSSKIWPIYYGLSDDLMFWAAINTLFLTRVKHLDAGQINLIMSLSVIVCFFWIFFDKQNNWENRCVKIHKDW